MKTEVFLRHVRYLTTCFAITSLVCCGLSACAPSHEGASGMGVEIGPAENLPPGWSEQNGALVFEATDELKSAEFSDDRGVVAINEPVRRKVMVRNLSSETLGSSGPVRASIAGKDGIEPSDVAVCACEPGGTVYLGALPPGGCMVLVFKLRTDSPGEKETKVNYLGVVDFKLSGVVDPGSSRFQFAAGGTDVSDPSIGACGS